jgi:cytochrome c oxidase subunit IV
VNAVSEKRLLVVWLALSAITLVSLSMSLLDGADALTPNAVVASSAIVIALVKTRIIFREFMEVRHARVLLRRVTDAWLLVTAACLLGAYFVGTALSTR